MRLSFCLTLFIIMINTAHMLQNLHHVISDNVLMLVISMAVCGGAVIGSILTLITGDLNARRRESKLFAHCSTVHGDVLGAAPSRDARRYGALMGCTASVDPIVPLSPRFGHVFCSQCGEDFGPGDEGYSHCVDHAGKYAELF